MGVRRGYDRFDRYQRRQRQTVEYAREALALAERSGIPGSIPLAEEVLGLGLAGLGQYDEATALLERSLDNPSAQRRAAVA